MLENFHFLFQLVQPFKELQTSPFALMVSSFTDPTKRKILNFLSDNHCCNIPFLFRSQTNYKIWKTETNWQKAKKEGVEKISEKGKIWSAANWCCIIFSLSKPQSFYIILLSNNHFDSCNSNLKRELKQNLSGGIFQLAVTGRPICEKLIIMPISVTRRTIFCEK